MKARCYRDKAPVESRSIYWLCYIRLHRICRYVPVLILIKDQYSGWSGCQKNVCLRSSHVRTCKSSTFLVYDSRDLASGIFFLKNVNA